MLKLVFIIIIIYIVIQHLMDEPKPPLKLIKEKKKPSPVNEDVTLTQSGTAIEKPNIINNVPTIILEARPQEVMVTREGFANSEEDATVWTFNKPNPWSSIKRYPNEEYEYHFRFKVRIPSLNDLENWKQIVPNIDFDPKTGEIIIPSKDEGSALALANLMVSNFFGQLSLDEILTKNLIQVSVTKAQSYEIVRNKLREQIIDNIYGNPTSMSKSALQTDLAQGSCAVKATGIGGSIEAYDGTEYSYI